MLDSLSEKISQSLSQIKGKRKINEKAIQETLQTIHLALLDGDVNLKVVTAFVDKVKTKAIGTNLLGGLNAGEQFIQLIYEELVIILGKEVVPLNINKKPSIIMMVGLQGSGKTTTAAKLAKFLHKTAKKKTLLVAADIYRPAAIEQLKVLGKRVNSQVFEKGNQDPQITIKEAIIYAKKENITNIIIDTAGRLHIDEKLMDELIAIKTIAQPDEILIVIDAMTGQEVVNVVSGFDQYLKLTGAILTKLDGDTRGGAAFSIRYLTNIPIKLIGTGEKVNKLELFFPNRMASRILGMGDIASLIEKVKEVISEDDAKKTATKLLSGKFNLNDLLIQLKNIQKFGSSKMLALIPGAPKINNEQKQQMEEQLKIVTTLINSMTKTEKINPKLLKQNTRKQRIIKGSGKNVQDFNKLIRQYEQMQKMAKMMKGNKGGLSGQISNLGSSGFHF